MVLPGGMKGVERAAGEGEGRVASEWTGERCGERHSLVRQQQGPCWEDEEQLCDWCICVDWTY